MIVNPYLRKEKQQGTGTSPAVSATLASRTAAGPPVRTDKNGTVGRAPPVNSPHQIVAKTTKPPSTEPKHSTAPTTPMQSSSHKIASTPVAVTPRETTKPNFHGQACQKSQVNSHPMLQPPTVSPPPSTTLKQRLKQQISSLRKKKQDYKLQLQAQERRRLQKEQRARKEKERRALEEERERLRQAKIQQRQEKLRHKQLMQERKQKEREQKRLEKEQQAKLLVQLAEDEYARDQARYKEQCEVYLRNHAQWIQQRHSWMQMAVTKQQQQQKAVFQQAGVYWNQGVASRPNAHVVGQLNPVFLGAQPAIPMAMPLPTPPAHLWTPPTPPVPPQKPRRLVKRQHKNAQPQATLLCPALDSPSPWAETHQLLPQTITLIREMPNQTSFGVNLKVIQTSRLVDQSPPQSASTCLIQSASTCLTESKPTLAGTREIPPKDGKIQQATLAISETVQSRPTSLPAKQSGADFKPATQSTPPHAENPLQGDAGGMSKANIETNAASSDSMSSSNNEQNQAQGTILSASPLPSAEAATVSPPVRRRRRRRVHFAAMTVVDANKQNERWPEHENLPLLQPGDLMVSIGGTPIAGMSFEQACHVFSEKSVRTEDKDGISFRVQVQVARQKPKPAKQLNPLPSAIPSARTLLVPIPTPVSPKPPPPTTGRQTTELTSFKPPDTCRLRPPNLSLTFGVAEIAMLANSTLLASQSTLHPLGQAISHRVVQATTEIFRQVAILPPDTPISHREPATLLSKWNEIASRLDSDLAQRGRNYWASSLMEETGTPAGSLPFASDAERAALRQLPRPGKGCRCQSMHHEYLHDERCTLYRDLSRLLSAKELSHFIHKQPEKPVASSATMKPDGEDRKIATARRDRKAKLQAAMRMEQEEAKFVARMEELQVKECRKAVFAPSLTAMILSTVLELQRFFPNQGEDSRKEDSGVDVEDGWSLAALGRKRQVVAAVEESTGSKKPRIGAKLPQLNLKYAFRMIQFISRTWGHVYREPSHEEHAWRWELYHGHNSEDVEWESQSKNPRPPNSLPFENAQFFGDRGQPQVEERLNAAAQSVRELMDQIQWNISVTNMSMDCAEKAKASTTHQQPETQNAGKAPESPSKRSQKNVKLQEMVFNIPQKDLELLCLVAHWLSPANSGICDEFMALVRTGVLQLDASSGIPSLSIDWASKVDFVLLDDMDASWGTEADPDGRYGVNLELRDTLEEQWVKLGGGWALTDDPDDVVFNFDVLDEWRQVFEGRVEERVNLSEGIGRFGL